MQRDTHEYRVEGSTPKADQLANGQSGVAGETATKRVEPSMRLSCDCDTAKAWALAALFATSSRFRARAVMHALEVEARA